MDWLKLNSKGILRGSMATSDYTVQLIWIKLLAMANETRDRDGYLRFAEGKPYSLTFIADVCNVKPEELNRAIAEFREDMRDGSYRVIIADDGSVYLSNWARYQVVPEDKVKPTGRELELYKRQQLNKLAKQYPIEALNVPEVKKIVEGEMNDQHTNA